MDYKKYMDIAPEVKEALSAGKPVVALESTIIAQGMPYPDNVNTALAVESVIREAGVTPATIGLIKGRIKVGLAKEDIEYLAKTEGVWKVSRRDIAPVVAGGLDGATTVAATMIIAAMAGIRVFVTGGVGGVHREASRTFDISADLQELENTDVAVVCAGCKSILDIPATLEYLETAGVPVITYQANEFPAFYSRCSGCRAELRMDSPMQVAQTIRVKYELGLHGGLLIACPVPADEEIPYEFMERTVQKALTECEEQKITGKRVTPFLMDKILKLSGGSSLEANKALVLNNAKIGAAIALELTK